MSLGGERMGGEGEEGRRSMCKQKGQKSNGKQVSIPKSTHWIIRRSFLRPDTAPDNMNLNYPENGRSSVTPWIPVCSQPESERHPRQECTEDYYHWAQVSCSRSTGCKACFSWRRKRRKEGRNSPTRGLVGAPTLLEASQCSRLSPGQAYAAWLWPHGRAEAMPAEQAWRRSAGSKKSVTARGRTSGQFAFGIRTARARVPALSLTGGRWDDMHPSAFASVFSSGNWE